MDLTNAEYVKAGGNVCPFCRSKDGVEGKQQIETDDYGATQPVHCTICKREWTDLYSLVGYRKED